MSAVFNNDTGKILSATLTGTAIAVQTHNRLITCRTKFVSLPSIGLVLELDKAGFSVIQHLNVQAGIGTDGYFTMDSGATEWDAIAPGEVAGAWALQGVYMPHNQAASLTCKHYRNGSTATAAATGDASTGAMDLLSIGHGFIPPDMKICEVAIWLVADQAAADLVYYSLYNGGNGKYADAISSVATPDYYWKLFDDETATEGSPDLTNTGSVTFDSDNPTLLPLPDYPAAGAWLKG